MQYRYRVLYIVVRQEPQKCVPCAYVLDNFAAARGMANLSEIYMSASPEGPFTSIANANSSVGLSTVTRLTTTVFYDTSFNTPSMWRMSIWPPDPPTPLAAPAPLVEPVLLRVIYPICGRNRLVHLVGLAHNPY